MKMSHLEDRSALLLQRNELWLKESEQHSELWLIESKPLKSKLFLYFEYELLLHLFHRFAAITYMQLSIK